MAQDLTPATVALIETAFASSAAATAADSAVATAQTALTAAQAAIIPLQQADVTAHQQATADALAALQAVATELGVTLPASAHSVQ